MDKSLPPIVSWDNNSMCTLINWVRKQCEFDSPTVRVVSRRSKTNEVSIVNIEIIVEVTCILAPIIQAEVKRSMLEFTQKVMSKVSSFMKM